MIRPKRSIQAKHLATVALLVLAIAWLSTLVIDIWRKQVIAREAVASTRLELAQLEERRAALAAQVAELSTDRGREAVLRQNQRVARPGEEVIIVVPEDAPAPPPPPTFWERVRDWLPW